MRLSLAACLWFAALCWASLPACAQAVARVLDEEISSAELAAAGDEAARIARFRDLVWKHVARRYVAERGLTATPEEVVELLAYDREFERRDRAQRARKLAELNQRLAHDGLAADERARLEQFRAVLTRLAESEAGNDRPPPPDPAAFYRPWIETWKANRALYEQYGGIVVLTWSGPEPHGARVALIRDYERRGVVRFLDPRLREQLYALLAQPPSMIVPAEQVDFTPYWKLPIPPSYFAD